MQACAHGVTPDGCVSLQGGAKGAEQLRDSAELNKLLSAQKDSGRQYAAICASPAVFFQAKGLLNNHKATAHPGFSDKLSNQRYDKLGVVARRD